MNQSLADIAVPKRHTANSQRPHQEDIMKQRFPAAKTAQGIEIQRVHIHVDHTRRHKQRQLDQRVIDHMKQTAAHSDQIFRSHQSGHADAYQNKSDLGDGGTCQRPFQIDGKERQHRTYHHRTDTQQQDHAAPGRVAEKKISGQDQDTVHPCFGQNTGQESGSRSRSHRMRFGQPDMEGKSAGLGSETEEQAESGDPQLCHGGGSVGRSGAPFLCDSCGLQVVGSSAIYVVETGQFVEEKRSRHVIEQEDAH